MSLISIPFTFTVGQTIVASSHNSNFQTIYNDYDGNITDANISASAAVGYSKLSLNASIQNSDLLVGVGTSANNIVALNGSAKLPAVDGSLLTNVTVSAPLGSWTSKSFATIYQAATDGFVLAYAFSNGTLINGITDSSATPTTVRISSYSNNENVGICFPVKKNDYYEVTMTGNTSPSMYFIPLGN